MSDQTCAHIESIDEVKKAEKQECFECMKIGSPWVNLRTCQTCGVTHCCDSSPNKHATAHYHKTEHPVMTSSKEDERWLWCFKDEVTKSY